MIEHEINHSGNNAIPPVVESFHLDPADRAALCRFFAMDADELVAELQLGANLSRPDLQSIMFGTLKAASIGVGMSPGDARDRAFNLLQHNSVAREIALKILAD